ncbi:MAG: hypothetical protein KGI08_09450 [Thaumarchaeota archaeon]|nr:hypothetical protein [Nitrososphaerota archaeon]
MKPEGIFKNGDLWFGESDYDDQTGQALFAAYLPDNNPDDGADYCTPEVPERFPLFAMTTDGTPESQANEYFLAKKIGDARFGSACQHSRAKRGYCPDCLRKVI